MGSRAERHSSPPPQNSGDTRAGFFFALTAYSLWSVLAFYIKALAHIDPVEVTLHRALWSLPVAAIILWWLGRTSDILPTLRNSKSMKMLAFTATIIALNWGIFVWAVGDGRTIEAALGYYINPLITVLFGAIFLGERFSTPQLIALILATAAVLLLTIVGGVFPWVSLSLAITFALYGLVRKTVDVGPTQGFLVEIILIFPFAFIWLMWLLYSAQSQMFDTPYNTLLLLGCGPATAIPLILFAFGAKGLTLSTIGLMQYIVPTNLFLIGLFAFGEPFSSIQLIAFVLIWLALAIYSWSSLRAAPAK